MKTRVALVGCKDSCEGVWTLSKGNEVGLRIDQLGQGEVICVNMEIGETKASAIFDHAGVFDLPWKRMEKYRVGKQVVEGITSLSTTVEVVLNGQAHG